MGPSPVEGNRLAERAIEPFSGRLYLYCGYSPHYFDEGPGELERAVVMGFPRALIEWDPDFQRLSSNKRYVALLEAGERKPGT